MCYLDPLLELDFSGALRVGLTYPNTICVWMTAKKKPNNINLSSTAMVGFTSVDQVLSR
jgi:hypothetical protein